MASVLAVDMGYDDGRAARALSLVRELWPGMQSVRIIGSAALGLAYAACGRFDLFVHHMLYPWDIAAGILLVREAGGAITRPRRRADGHPQRGGHRRGAGRPRGLPAAGGGQGVEGVGPTAFDCVGVFSFRLNLGAGLWGPFWLIVVAGAGGGRRGPGRRGGSGGG